MAKEGVIRGWLSHPIQETKMKKLEPGNSGATSARAHAGAAVQRAQELVDSRPEGAHTTAWYHEAHHVGDMSVVAVTLRD
jgi:hypothetical protein